MRRAIGVLSVATLFAVACSSGDEQETAAASPDSGEVVPASAAAAAPQDADHEFLRMMSDHHEGLVVMGQDAMSRAADDSVRNAAHMLHTKQAAGRDTMVMMISQTYNEQYTPKMMPKNQAQADTLRQRQGGEIDRYFLQTTIAHHEEGIAMIDRFMQRFTKPDVRAMAERMRGEQQREIAELQGKLQGL
jgi:uncharacterized protein (DUF305 family)